MAPRLLTQDERREMLSPLSGWSMVEGRDAIRKRFTFNDFVEAFGWMTRVALTAERLDHHPDWSNSYRNVDVTLTTHSAGGLTERDIALAQAMDSYAAG